MNQSLTRNMAVILEWGSPGRAFERHLPPSFSQGITVRDMLAHV
jgi:hypothetical protein